MSEEQPKVEEVKLTLPRMQYIFVVLADGRRGAFAGPELVTSAEMTLQCVPRLVSVEFSIPKDVTEPKPLNEVLEEATNVEQTPDNPQPAAPEAGLV